ncbi:MAG: RNase P subunit p30 family protein, partial [Candidatus Aenigmatarchaeota archaeon]
MTERKFYDLNVSFGEGGKKLVERAERLELFGVCLVHNYFDKPSFEEYLGKIEKLRENTDIDIISGVMLSGPAFEKVAREIRRKVEIILVEGGNYEVNRKACASDFVDILSCPQRGRRDCGIDHICCKDARAHNTMIELNFRELLTSVGGQRIKELNLMKEIIRLCIKTSAPFIVNSGAKNLWELRGGRELTSLPYALGAGLFPSLASNSELPERLVKLNRDKIRQPLSGVYIEQGTEYG